MEFIWMLVLAVGLYFYVRNREERRKEEVKEQWAAAEDFEVAQAKRVIDESVHLVNTSKNYATKIGRLGVAIEKLSYLYERYPHRSDVKKALDECLAHRVPIHTEAVEALVKKHMDKARLARTIATKINNTNKALEALKEALDDQYVDRGKVAQSVLFVQQYIHAEELKDLESRAERFEFKENYKKALDCYLDALFFLRKDDVDDALQAREIGRIEKKIEQLKKVLGK